MGTRVRKAAVAGLFFYAAKRVADDVIQGVDYRLIAIGLVGAVAFGCMMYGWLWWWDRRAIKRAMRTQRP
jgi:hypothetical protein